MGIPTPTANSRCRGSTQSDKITTPMQVPLLITPPINTHSYINLLAASVGSILRFFASLFQPKHFSFRGKDFHEMTRSK